MENKTTPFFTPLNKMTFVLAIMLLIALIKPVYFSLFQGEAYNYVTLVSSATVLIVGICTFAFLKFTTNQKKSWPNLLTTLLILALLVQPLSLATAKDFLLLALIPVIAVCLKFYGVYKGRPLLNPAVAAAFIVPLFEPSILISWWGVNPLGYYSFLPLLIWLFWGFLSWRKTWLAASFLLAFAGMGALLNGEKFLPILTDPTVYFLALVMLVEPKTSPVKRNQQIAAGVFVGVLMVNLLNVGALQPYLVPLLAMNILYFFNGLAASISAAKSKNL